MSLCFCFTLCRCHCLNLSLSGLLSLRRYLSVTYSYTHLSHSLWLDICVRASATRSLYLRLCLSLSLLIFRLAALYQCLDNQLLSSTSHKLELQPSKAPRLWQCLHLHSPYQGNIKKLHRAYKKPDCIKSKTLIFTK